jgi:hypothetical protein
LDEVHEFLRIRIIRLNANGRRGKHTIEAQPLYCNIGKILDRLGLSIPIAEFDIRRPFNCGFADFRKLHQMMLLEVG